MGQRYLVTGAAGFIASHVSRMLLDAGHEVVGVDDLNAAYDPRLKQSRIACLAALPSFRFERIDITNAAELERFFASSTPFAAVLNLAARAGVRQSILDPRIYFRTNCEGTLNLLELCRQYGVRKFVLASTSSLYGADNSLPFCENADTSRPLSPYAASKKGAESITYSYHHLHGIDISVLRYFTVYGPAGRPDMSIFRFMHTIAAGKPITVYGDGSQQRDFTYVGDIARGTIAALRPVGFEVVNLGSDRPMRLDAVIEQIGNIVGRRPVIQRLPAHPADVPATWASIEKAGRLFDWRTQVSLEDGLQRTAQWHRENHELVSTLNFGE
jgi:UDP-glucuronate 4-epimerase